MRLTATPHNLASELALEIYSKVLDAVRADTLVHQALQRIGDSLFIQGRHIDLSHYDRVWIAGVGKASVAMAKACVEILDERLAGGLVITKVGSLEMIPGIVCIEAAHPVPDQSSIDAGEQMLEFARQRDEKDLILFLLSGGTSSLMEAPCESITLEDLQETNKLLLASGADITSINKVRSRLSQIKAGGLARAFEPATVIGIVLSDVVGNNLQAIGSGPLIAAEPKPGNLPPIDLNRLPDSVRLILQIPALPGLPEAPVEHFVIGSVTLAVLAAADAAKSLGLRPLPFGDPMLGEARAMARTICRHADRFELDHSCMIFGGETTVTIRGKGLGGRCQEMALAVVQPISKLTDVCFLAAGTDGTDGPTDAAGGFVDPSSMDRARYKGLSQRTALTNNDSYHYLAACDGLIRTGPSGSNVNDLVLVVHASV